MKAVQVLIVLLSARGYWFGGQAGTVTIRWATERPPADAVLVWDLMLGEVRLTGDRVAVGSGSPASTLTITPPEVRVRTSLRLVYRLLAREGGKELASGQAIIHVYPRDLLAGLDKRLAGKRIVVWDTPQGLPQVFEAAKIPHKRIDRGTDLQFARPDLILVGPDQIDATAFSQTALVGQAQAGASVLIFAQTRTKVLAGFDVARRPAPSKLEWRANHPLLQGFRPEDLHSWLDGPERDRYAIRLPVNEPALEIGYWAREVPGAQPVPIDALLVAKAVGAGRIVLCQIPLESWQTDPRSQLLLANALNYLSTRPEPTPPPSQRLTERPRPPETMPTITIPPGGTP